MIKAKYTRGKFDPNKLKEGIVRVGWFSGIRYEDGLSVAQVARWQEFGTPYAKYPIKARPFMRPVLHGRGNEMREKLHKAYSKALKDNQNTMIVLGRFGEYLTSQIRQSIRMTVNPPNRPITVHGGWLKSRSGKSFYVEPKLGNHPLIDTKVMINSLTYQIEEVHRK